MATIGASQRRQWMSMAFKGTAVFQIFFSAFGMIPPLINSFRDHFSSHTKIHWWKLLDFIIIIIIIIIIIMQSEALNFDLGQSLMIWEATSPYPWSKLRMFHVGI